MTLPSDLSFEQARGIYSALVAGSSMGRSQAELLGELSLDDRKVVVKAIEVLENNKKQLMRSPGDSEIRLAKDDRMMSLINKLKGSSGYVFTNQVLAQELKKSRPLAVQGRAEIVMANTFFIRDKFLGAMKPGGELYNKLEAITIGQQAPNERGQHIPNKQKAIVKELKNWVDQLDPGEGKKAAEEALKNITNRLRSLTFESGFNESNLRQLVDDFTTEVHTAVVEAWNKEPLTSRDLQAMGIGSLGLMPFLSNKTINQKKEEFKNLIKTQSGAIHAAQIKLRGEQTLENAQKYVKVCNDALTAIEKFEASVLPLARYPEFSVLYSQALGEHAHLIFAHSVPAKEAACAIENTIRLNQNESLFNFTPFKLAETNKASELTKLQILYAMYGAARGNGEGNYTVAESVLNYGDWSIDKRKETGKNALTLIDIAIGAAKKAGDKDLLRKAKVLRADILAKDYLVAVELRNDPNNLQKKLGLVGDTAVKAYAALASDGIPGLYQLFLNAGVSADPMIDLLSNRLVTKMAMFRPKPNAEEIKMITTAALAGNKKAVDLLNALIKMYPLDKTALGKNMPELHCALLLMEAGAFTLFQQGQEFTLQDAVDCYQWAVEHITTRINELSKDGKLTEADLASGKSSLDALKRNYNYLISQNNVADSRLIEDEKILFSNPSLKVQPEPAAPIPEVVVAKAAVDQPELPPLPRVTKPAFSVRLIRSMLDYINQNMPSFNLFGSRSKSAEEINMGLFGQRLEITDDVMGIVNSQEFRDFFTHFETYVENNRLGNPTKLLEEQLLQDIGKIAEHRGENDSLDQIGLLRICYQLVEGSLNNPDDRFFNRYLKAYFPDDAKALSTHGNLFLSLVKTYYNTRGWPLPERLEISIGMSEQSTERLTTEYDQDAEQLTDETLQVMLSRAESPASVASGSSAIQRFDTFLENFQKYERSDGPERDQLKNKLLDQIRDFMADDNTNEFLGNAYSLSKGYLLNRGKNRAGYVEAVRTSRNSPFATTFPSRLNHLLEHAESFINLHDLITASPASSASGSSESLDPELLADAFNAIHELPLDLNELAEAPPLSSDQLTSEEFEIAAEEALRMLNQEPVVANFKSWWNGLEPGNQTAFKSFLNDVGDEEQFRMPSANALVVVKQHKERFLKFIDVLKALDVWKKESVINEIATTITAGREEGQKTHTVGVLNTILTEARYLGIVTLLTRK